MRSLNAAVLRTTQGYRELSFQLKLNAALIGFFLLLTFYGCGGGGGGSSSGGGTPTNIAPSADAGPDQTVTQGEQVTLNGSASSDPDGTIASYKWVQTSGTTVSLLNADTPTAHFTAPHAATRQTLVFELIVTDNKGSQGTDSCSIAINVPPTVSAGADQSLSLSAGNTQLVTLTGTDSDSDGSIVSRQWTQTGGTTVSLSGANTSSATFTAPAATQAYTFSYTVTDNDGAQSTDTVAVYVTRIIFSDTFANASNWNFIDDTNNGASWSVDSVNNNSQLHQTAFLDINDGILKNNTSYHLGTYALLTDPSLSNASNYRFSVDITPLPNTTDPSSDEEGNDVGVMFRYQNASNYYRVSMSAMYGFTRFEKYQNGTFQTLAVDARGYVDNNTMNLTVEVNGDIIMVWIDGDPVFAVDDSTSPITSGTVALYCQDEAAFDNVQITENTLQPEVVISTPLAYSVALTQNAGTTLSTQAVTLNTPAGGGVNFTIDNGGAITGTVSNDGHVYSTDFTNVTDGEHEIGAVLEDADGKEVSSDINSTVGTGGDYYITIGDSITNGYGDENPNNNDSNDGCIISSQGYQAPLDNELNDYYLSLNESKPVIVFNEGIAGDTAALLESRIASILKRHPRANKVLMMIGTNDSGSGVDPNTFINEVNTIAGTITGENKQLWIARILPTNGDTTLNDIIKQYNTEIDNNAGVYELGPDFYTIFDEKILDGQASQYYSGVLHPNDNGYQLMAGGWYNTLPK